MTPSPPTVRRLRLAELSPAEIRALWELWHRVFPKPGATLEERMARFLASSHMRHSEAFTVWDGARPLASASVFPREILTTRGPLVVMALAGVCSAPERRGDGLGRLVTRAAFGEVERGAYAVSLFQTGVPEFYAKLGARTVDNPFINSRFAPADPAAIGPGTREQPWWSTQVMIYPAAYDWPAGPVDLLGPGY